MVHNVRKTRHLGCCKVGFYANKIFPLSSCLAVFMPHSLACLNIYIYICVRWGSSLPHFKISALY